MPMISDHVEFVKRQAEFNRRQYERLLEKTSQEGESSAARRAVDKLPLYERLSAGFESLLSAMEADLVAWEAMKLAAPATTNDEELNRLLQEPIDIHPSTLAGLPEELIAQLQISDADRFQWGVVEIINRTPEKTISIEVLLIALFRQTGKIYERADLANRMSRLSRKGAAFPVQGRKAVYTTIPQNGIEVQPEDEELQP